MDVSLVAGEPILTLPSGEPKLALIVENHGDGFASLARSKSDGPANRLPSNECF